LGAACARQSSKHLSKHLSLSLLAAASLSCLASAASAQVSTLDPVVVTASRTPMRLNEVVSDFTVISREDIERQGFGALVDVLRQAGALEFTRNGGPGAVTSAYLRGSDSRHTLVMIDGVRIDSQATGGAPWESIPLEQVERIEVLKGPASAIYGSDAVGGVVHIITRKGEGAPRWALSAAAGNLDTFRLGASVAGKMGEFDYAVGLSSEESQGFNAVSNPDNPSYNPDADGWKKKQASVRLGAQVNTAHRVEFSTVMSHLNSQFDSWGSSADDRSLQDVRSTGLSWQARWSPEFETTARWADSSNRYESQPGTYQTETRVSSTTLSGNYAFSSRHQMNAVLEQKKDALDNDYLTQTSTPGHAERRQKAFGVGYVGRIEALDVQAHVRQDDDSEFGKADTGTLGVGWRLSQPWRLVASVGTAFRAPTVFQSFSDYGPDLSKPGVSPLKAEHGRNRELGLKWLGGEADASLIAYRNTVSDLIIYGEAGSCRDAWGCYQNVSAAQLQGLSLSASVREGDGLLRVSFDAQSPTDRSTDKLLPRRAQRFGTLRLQSRWLHTDWGVSLQAFGSRFNDAANTQRLGGYGLLNLDLRHALNAEWQLQANLDNALNKRYATALDYAQSPRTLLVGVRYSPLP
jgi:vitamin B12 transporter